MRYCFKEIKFRKNLIYFCNKVRNNLIRIFFTANKTLFLKYCGFVVPDMQYEWLLVEGCGLSALPLASVQKSPPPSGKIGRGDVCESPTIIVFPFPGMLGTASDWL